MRHFAITGIDTDSWISRILETGDIRATPPSRRMSAGTRSSAITAAAPAASAIFACSALTTSMMTPPFSISARPTFTRYESVCRMDVLPLVAKSNQRRGFDHRGPRARFLHRLREQRDARLDRVAFDAGNR